MAEIIYHQQNTDCPESVLNTHLEKGRELLLLVPFELDCYWLTGDVTERHTAVYMVSAGVISVAVGGEKLSVPESSSSATVVEVFRSLCGLNDLAAVELGKPVILGEVQVEKPWGREIWYTGIESRGVCSAYGNSSSNRNSSSNGKYGLIELPLLLTAAPQRLTSGFSHKLILLKILDPLVEEGLGDLYFELHEEKREVYVVTHIDSQAWPAAEGAIRMGFDQSVRAEYPNDSAFRAAYLTAVSNYRLIRDEIDGLIDDYCASKKEDVSRPIGPTLLQEATLNIPPALSVREKTSRELMHRFTKLNPLTVGDVVKVPTYTPHALQHGVRTVEFQTPVYERMIMSFGQKVLTQNHWDTERAVELMRLEVEAAFNELELLSNNAGVVCELVVEFEDFRVLRVSCESGAEYKLAAPPYYQLMMMVQGKLEFSGAKLDSEQACLLPPCFPGAGLVNRNAEVMIFLLAEPIFEA